jgi:hypothetical protein
MQIPLSDWINIIQTFILLLTGLAIVWYTWETKNIRKETSVQNTLLAEQVRLMQATRQDELAKQMSFITPFFRFGGGNTSGNRAQYEFTNKGGPARKLSTKPLGAFSVSVSPQRLIDANEKGSIAVGLTELVNTSKYPFEISCLDKLGKEHVFKFFYQHGRGILEDGSV